jgi:hypothetical protein
MVLQWKRRSLRRTCAAVPPPAHRIARNPGSTARASVPNESDNAKLPISLCETEKSLYFTQTIARSLPWQSIKFRLPEQSDSDAKPLFRGHWGSIGYRARALSGTAAHQNCPMLFSTILLIFFEVMYITARNSIAGPGMHPRVCIPVAESLYSVDKGTDCATKRVEQKGVGRDGTMRPIAPTPLYLGGEISPFHGDIRMCRDSGAFSESSDPDREAP